MSATQTTQWQALQQAIEEYPHDLPDISEYHHTIRRVMQASPWCWQKWVANPARLTPQWYQQGFSKQQLYAELQQQLQHVTNAQELSHQLRLFRTQHQLRFIWRSTLALTATDTHTPLSHPSTHSFSPPFTQTLTQELADFADVCIDCALQWHYQDLVKRYGEPQNSEGQAQHMVVLGMGKLGGGELNLSSDIDLIFAFPEAGTTVSLEGQNTKSIDNQLFFVRLGQSLIQALDQQTADGFVFRVDMRLRPYGDSGAIALNFNAMEMYYQDQGREWERYAFIKARVVAGNQQAGATLIELLRPFVYRRYIDFSVIESLRGLKQLIANEVRRLDLEDNIKLGSGGIREVEFIAQTFQLIYGGKDARLQTPRLMEVINLLPELTDWPQDLMQQLQTDYWFLRDIEHALQSVGDMQTQQLPNTSAEQTRLVQTLGYKTWDSLKQDIKACRQRIHSLFTEIIRVEETASIDSAQQSDIEQSLSVLCSQLSMLGNQLPEDTTAWQQTLQQAGFAEPQQVLQPLLNLYQSHAAASMQPIAEQRLVKILPTLLLLASLQDGAEQVVARVLVFIEAVLRRSVYLVLLQESPTTLSLLIKLCAASPWFGDFLAKQPALLDELLDSNVLLSEPTMQDLAQELQQRLLRVPTDDTEQMIFALNHFKNASSLRAAAQQVTDKLPLMKVSDVLTYTAEIVLQQVLRQAWQELSQRYGQPSSHHLPDEQSSGQALALPQENAEHFLIVGYGKVGGWELSFGSDLDLVFIFDAPHDAMTIPTHANSKSVANSVFFTRLGQRIINYLNSMTSSGQLYEVDMRLRPNGAKGLLASTLQAFDTYQHQQAWVWEHQALVRARPLVGCQKLATKFLAVRNQVIQQIRDQQSLRLDVLNMREKMRANLGEKSASKQHTSDKQGQAFHLKQGLGGMVDIEFIVQYLVLAYAHKYPQLTEYTDNIRLLDIIESHSLLPQKDCVVLRDTYCEIRFLQHQQVLQNRTGQVGFEQLQEQRQQVQSIWQQVMQVDVSDPKTQA